MENNKPKVLHLIESGGLYGAERVILNLSKQMESAGAFTPVVGCIVSSSDDPSDLYDAAVGQGIEAIKVVIPNRQLPWALPAAARRLKKAGISLVHSHGYKPSVYAYVIRWLTGLEIMATCHLWFEPQNAPFKTRLMMGLEKRFYRSFRKIVAVSDPIRQVLVDAGIRPERVEVVENGVDMTSPSVRKETLQSLRREFGLASNDYCLLNAARLTRQKDQKTLVEVARVLKTQGVAFRLLIVGQGPLETQLREQVQRFGLEREVILTGFRSDVAALLALADLFVLPSLDEGMPMSLLEAVAAGVPVISTAVGDIPKLIRHEESGLIVQPEAPEAVARAVMTLIRDGEKARQLALSARELMATRYSQQAMGEHYHRVYDSLLDPGGQRVYN